MVCTLFPGLMCTVSSYTNSATRPHPPARFNAGYIFPLGFKSRLLFRSSINLDAMCIHECEILGQGGSCWPAPTFCVTALDRPDEPLQGKSATACWTQASSSELAASLYIFCA